MSLDSSDGSRGERRRGRLGSIGRLGDEDRERMIDETSAFLSWAMRSPGRVPEVPRRRVSEGGFSDLLKRPMGRVVAERWWGRAIERLADHYLGS